MTDEWTKEGLAIEVVLEACVPHDGRIRSGRVIAVLSRLVSERGAPLHLRSDNGPEFVSRALLQWIVDQGIGCALIDPGKPWQNGATESFNGKCRTEGAHFQHDDECLNLEWFRSRAEAKVVIEAWRKHYNAVRPHSRLGYLTPEAFAAQCRDATDDRDRGPQRAVSPELGSSAPRPVAPASTMARGATERVAVSS